MIIRPLSRSHAGLVIKLLHLTQPSSPSYSKKRKVQLKFFFAGLCHFQPLLTSRRAVVKVVVTCGGVWETTSERLPVPLTVQRISAVVKKVWRDCKLGGNCTVVPGVEHLWGDNLSLEDCKVPALLHFM